MLMVEVLLGMPLTYAPQLSPPVEVIGQGDLPAILVDVEHAFGVDIALAIPESGLDHPDPVQLVARQILVDMAGLDDLLVLERRRVQLIAVVRDVNLTLTQQLPVVAIHCPAEHVE